MVDRTYKLIELVGVSEKSYAEATQNAIKKASQTLEGLAWFEVTQMRGIIADGRVAEFQVTIKVGFRVLGATELQSDVVRMPRRERAVRRASRAR